MHISLIRFIRDIYCTKEFIPLHAPTFRGNERQYVLDTLDSTFVSSVGAYVERFERQIESFTGATKAVATVNGTAALHMALYMAGVRAGDLVITQPLTFVATCNALFHMGAEPVFVDVSRQSLGLCPKALSAWLDEYAAQTEFGCVHKETGRTIRAVVPMHTFGHPVELDELQVVCEAWNIQLVEDAAESLGSFYKERHTGTIAPFGAFSFNGNKIITTGGGGMVLCQDSEQGTRTKHITTTAKVPHPFEFYHDEPGFNYRLPNLNAALGCAQMESLALFLEQKRRLAACYADYFRGTEYQFVEEPVYGRSNYWLNAVICQDKTQRDTLLAETNKVGIMTRPVWQLMHRLPMFSHALRGELTNAEWLETHLVNLPSTPVEN
ncbi:LegC family aminotransferase [Photorhabdus aegyptia]|uniref:Aminotransferase, LLPSF_NHT_00031 family n=1 Tax=Photorhabdus aegyptia TaxID=2805098 RepID=A0A022PIA2_9GAMM|nr:LegC family aminotransferase [Photorhabdus aegyptia]EYU15371.1 aminotransferase, LLPSF_NHT_00031 family [Photorhabdus aegyptia]KGM27549.1 aminotransferase DegT [Photorhabdus luminescens]